MRVCVRVCVRVPRAVRPWCVCECGLVFFLIVILFQVKAAKGSRKDTPFLEERLLSFGRFELAIIDFWKGRMFARTSIVDVRIFESKLRRSSGSDITFIARFVLADHHDQPVECSRPTTPALFQNVADSPLSSSIRAALVFDSFLQRRAPRTTERKQNS